MNYDIRAVVVCVNYDDILRVSLPATLPHVSEVLVITAPQDKATQEHLKDLAKVRVHVTDAFYRNNAKFNKGLALEEGFDVLGRKGWILIQDADIILPPDASAHFTRNTLKVGNLYTPPRRILADVKAWPKWQDHTRWHLLPGRKEDRGHYGYFQLFHAEDTVLRKRPWYSINWTHAGRADDEFQHRWTQAQKARPGFEVLHLGRCDENWFGRSTERLDDTPLDPHEAKLRREMQIKLRKKHGWGFKQTNEPFEERVIPDK